MKNTYESGGVIEMKEKYSELKELFTEETKRIGAVSFYEKMAAFCEAMKAKYKLDEYIHSKLWHLLIGSQADVVITELDLPNGEIEDFIRNEMPKFPSKK